MHKARKAREVDVLRHTYVKTWFRVCQHPLSWVERCRFCVYLSSDAIVVFHDVLVMMGIWNASQWKMGDVFCGVVCLEWMSDGECVFFLSSPAWMLAAMRQGCLPP